MVGAYGFVVVPNGVPFLRRRFFPLLREALVTSVAGVFRFMRSWWSACRQHSARYTAADPLLFADVYGRIEKKKADAHGYISVSTG